MVLILPKATVMAPRTESPFLARVPSRWNFGMDWLLLLMVVAAATATLTGYALYLPSVTDELNAWLGRSVLPVDREASRRSQIVFLMLCYAAPMILGLVTRLVHMGGRSVVRRLTAVEPDEAQFRME